MIHGKPSNRDAWIVLVTVFISMFIVFGIRLSYTVFYAAFTHYEGWPREASAGIYSVAMLMFAVASVPSGLALDRFGPRVLCTIGALFMVAGLWLCSYANSISDLMLAYGVITGMGLTILGLGPQGGIVSAWFPHRRGMAIGVASAGTGIGALVFTPLVERLIAWYGWRGAHTVLAIICAVALLPVIALGQRSIRTSHLSTATRINIRGQDGLLRSPAFWFLLIMSFGALGPLRTLTVHQVAYLEDIGYERLHASAFVGFAGLLTALAFIMWGPFSDRIGRRMTFTLGSAALAGAVGMLWMLGHAPIPSDGLLVLYSALYALAEGTRSSQSTAMATDAFGHSRMGFVMGAISAMFGLGAAFGPWIVGRLFDATGSYQPGFEAVLVMIGISLVGAFGVHHFALSRPRREREASAEGWEDLQLMPPGR